MQLTINVPDQFEDIAKEHGLTAESYLSTLANQEIMRHFREQKDGKSSKLLFG